MSWNWKLKMYNPEGNPPGGMCSFLLWYIKSDFSLVWSWGELLRDFEFQLMTWGMTPAPQNESKQPKTMPTLQALVEIAPKTQGLQRLWKHNTFETLIELIAKA